MLIDTKKKKKTMLKIRTISRETFKLPNNFVYLVSSREVSM
jgi:hypothetical protein